MTGPGNVNPVTLIGAENRGGFLLRVGRLTLEKTR
jgi:hypothetical protein